MFAEHYLWLLLGLYFTFHLLEGLFGLALGIILGVALGFGVAEARNGGRFCERILPVLRSWLILVLGAIGYSFFTELTSQLFAPYSQRLP